MQQFALLCVPNVSSNALDAVSADLFLIRITVSDLMFFGTVKMAPLKISKINTFMQIGFILAVLTGLAWELQMVLFIELLSYVVLVTSVASGAAYSYIWSARAMREPEEIPADRHSSER